MLGELVPLYHALAQIGISPLEVDRMEIWQVAAILEYRPPAAGGTSYAQGGVDPYAIARARAGEALQIGHAVVPPKGERGTLPKFRPSSYVPPEDRELTDSPVSP